MSKNTHKVRFARYPLRAKPWVYRKCRYCKCKLGVPTTALGRREKHAFRVARLIHSTQSAALRTVGFCTLGHPGFSNVGYGKDC